MADDDVQVKFGADTGGALDGIKGITSSLNQIRYAIEGLTNPLRAIRSNLGEIGDAFIAAFAVEQIIAFTERMADLGIETEKLAEQLGLSTKEVGEFQYMAGSVGVSGESAAMALERMTHGLTQVSSQGSLATQAMVALQIPFKDAAGNILPLNQLLPQIADKFAGFADGPNKTALAMDLFGRAGAQMIPVLNKGSEGIKELEDAADAAGVALSQQATAGMVQVGDAIYDLQGKLKGLTIEGFIAVEPVILDVVHALDDFLVRMEQVISDTETWDTLWQPLINDFSSAYTSLKNLYDQLIAAGQEFGIFNGAAFNVKDTITEVTTAVGFLTAGVDIVIGVVQEWVEWFRALGAESEIIAEGIGQAWLDLATNKWSQISTDWDAAMQKWEDETKTHAENVKNILAGVNAAINQALPPNALPGFLTPVAPTATLPEINIARPQAPQAKPDDSEKLRRERAQEFLEAEAAKRAALNETYATEASLNKLAFDQKKATLDQELSYGLITNQQYYSQLRELQQQDNAVNITALQNKRIALFDELGEELANVDITEKEKLKLKEQFALQSQKIDDQIRISNQRTLNQQVQDMQKALAQEIQRWQQFANTIASSFTSSLSGMLKGTTTWRQAVVNVLNSIVDAFANIVETMVQKWIDGQVAQLFATQSTGKAEAISRIGTSAGEAGAGGVASMAAAPFPLNLSAPAFGAEMAFDALSFTSFLGFSGGGVVDNDMLAKVHTDEMVLPASISQGIQSMVKNNNPGSSDGQSGGDNFHINISAVDGQSVQRFFMQHGRALVASLHDQKRNMNPFFSQGVMPT